MGPRMDASGPRYRVGLTNKFHLGEYGQLISTGRLK